MKKKICVVTGSRAEYGLLYPLLKKIIKDKDFDLQIVATGMHLSCEFGFTFHEILRDGFRITEKVEMLSSNDTEVGVSKSIGRGIIGFADTFKRLKPDFVLLLGDRFEIFSAAIAAFVAKIPIVHLQGGELTEGAMDDAIRHSITKMSILHFAATEEYRKRIIRLGESPRRVFTVGALGIDNIKNSKFLGKKELERELGLTFRNKTIVVTFHPETLSTEPVHRHFDKLLSALDSFKDLQVIFTKPNADPSCKKIITAIDRYDQKNPSRSKSFVSLGRVRYLSVLRYASCVVGNSSSGIIEVPSFGIPTVNIGDRQKGRILSDSVISCAPETGHIIAAMKKALSADFVSRCHRARNPYGNGTAAQKICRLLKRHAERISNVKKTFYEP